MVKLLMYVNQSTLDREVKMSEKTFDHLSSKTRALKRLRVKRMMTKQGGGDSKKMLQKAVEQVAKRKVQQGSYDKNKTATGVERVLPLGLKSLVGWTLM